MKRAKMTPVVVEKVVEKVTEQKTEIVDETGGLELLLNKNVLLICANYFYLGKLVGVNTTCVELENATMVFDLGDTYGNAFVDGKPNVKNAQKLPAGIWGVEREAIESWGAV